MALVMFGVIVAVTLGADMLIYHRLKHVTPTDWIGFTIGAIINAGVPMAVDTYTTRKKRQPKIADK